MTEFVLDLRKLGNKISSIRTEQKITQEILAAECNIDVRTIQRIEMGTQNITIAIIFALSNGLKTPPYELIRFAIQD